MDKKRTNDRQKLRCRKMLNMVSCNKENKPEEDCIINTENEDISQASISRSFTELISNSICSDRIVADNENTFITNTEISALTDLGPSPPLPIQQMQFTTCEKASESLLDISEFVHRTPTKTLAMPDATPNISREVSVSNIPINEAILSCNCTPLSRKISDFIASPTILYINKDYDLQSISSLEVAIENLEVENSITEPVEKNIGRKRKVNKDQWHDVKNKVLKNSGKAYVSKKTKTLHSERTMGPVCNCKLKCGDLIDEQTRKQIFELYWAIGDHERQWDFIIRYVQSVDIKKMTLNRKNNRTQTIEYSLPDTVTVSTKKKVCKAMFLSTLSITEKVVYTALEKISSGMTDNRGTHNNRPKRISDEAAKSIIEHINSFEVVEAHYVRKDSKKKYLEETLNLSKMYRLYIEWLKTKTEYVKIEQASKRQYEHIFNTKFNLSFHKPKKDQCDVCGIYKIADEQRKTELLKDYENHIESKNIVRRLKDEEKATFDSQSSVVACFDLEKVLTIPQSEVGPFHYKRKYPVYNFTIFDILQKKGYCYVWHFQIGKRGAIEIASCLWAFIQTQVNMGRKNISFYSDSCTGQNRNRFVFAMFKLAANKFNIKITHRFFEKGHSQSEGDSMHSNVERAKKRHTIYTPEQIYYLIENAKVTGEKYTVKQMTQKDFFDFKQIIQGKNWFHDISGNKIYWTKIREIKFSNDHPELVFFKYKFTDDYLELNTTNRVNNSRRRRGMNTNQEGTEGLESLKLAYQGPIPLPRLLYNDLISLCDSGAIPNHYQNFYRNLGVSNTATLNDDSDEED